ncbi:fumarylacetoacetase [Sphingomonas sp. ASY06-1R]|uniref:fumarylacetoacetase n=1 Tax=Sphingomonas sp. ASY06-1R TaxID=3445771 RepID=UPI003FA32898
MSAIDETHDPARTSWIDSANGHPDFPIQNLPLGIFSPPAHHARPGVAIGDMILDLSGVGALLPPAVGHLLTGTTLNRLLGLPAADRVAMRRRLSELLSDPAHRSTLEPLLHRAEECILHLPAAIGDYTDFYVGIHHATNVGKQFRPDNPLLPNYKYVPIGYHGRASSVRPSGVAVMRPNGQRKAPDEDVPSFGPSRRLDYELELGIWVGQGNELGHPIPIGEAHRHIAGYCLLNDWSARDIQAWEYQPLGPFLAKNFHTTISPWIVTAEALVPFRLPQPSRPEGDPPPLPYLFDASDQRRGAFALELEVCIATARMRSEGDAPVPLSRGSATNMYWTMAQILTHHASNGCNLQPGDLIGTGTISAAEAGGLGSLLEISQGGKMPVSLPNGETRAFLADGDEVTLRASARAADYVPIGFGACSAVILPAP